MYTNTKIKITNWCVYCVSTEYLYVIFMFCMYLYMFIHMYEYMYVYVCMYVCMYVPYFFFG